MNREEEARQRLADYRDANTVPYVGRWADPDERAKAIQAFHQFVADDLEWALREVGNLYNHIRVLTREVRSGCSRCH